MFLKKKKKEELHRCKALVCCEQQGNCEKIQSQLYGSDEKGFNVFFYRVDITPFAKEAKKMLRKEKYDLLIMDAFSNDEPNIQIVANAKADNPNMKTIILTPTLTSEIKEWKKNGTMDNFQLIPYQLMPFLKNVSDVLNNSVDDVFLSLDEHSYKENNVALENDDIILEIKIEDEDDEILL